MPEKIGRDEKCKSLIL